jgi:hypothetical protein
MTAPASWLVYQAWLDFFYAPGEGTLRLLPVADGRYPVVHPLFWGVVDREAPRTQLHIRRVLDDEPLDVRVLEVPPGMSARLVDAGRGPEAERSYHCYTQCVISPQKLRTGDSLTWTLKAED